MNLGKHLFWDTDPSKVDYEKHARQIIHRVLTRGTFKEVKEIQNYYGHDRILKEMMQVPSLDKKTLNFLSTVYRVPKEEFRCSKIGYEKFISES